MSSGLKILFKYIRCALRATITSGKFILKLKFKIALWQNNMLACLPECERSFAWPLAMWNMNSITMQKKITKLRISSAEEARNEGARSPDFASDLHVRFLATAGKNGKQFWQAEVTQLWENMMLGAKSRFTSLIARLPVHFWEVISCIC